MRTDRLSLEDRATSERVTTALLAAGAGVGLVVPALPIATSTTLAAVLSSIALLSAGWLRRSEDTLPTSARIVLAGAAAALGYLLGSGTALVLAMGAAAGLAMAGGGASSRRVTGGIAGAAGALWILWTLPALERLVPGWSSTARSVAGGAVAGLLFGAALLLLHVRVHADALAVRLTTLGGEFGARLERLWTRCHHALRVAPTAARKEGLRLLSSHAREAARLAEALVLIDARRAAANRTDAESQLALLRADAAAATDAMSRERLSRAASSLSDGLETLDAIDRKRERLEAELKLKLATLERSALALELAQGEPAELTNILLRLAQPAEA